MEKTVGVVSLGCSKNRVDTEHMLSLFQAQGYTIVNDPARASVLVVNTCGFIESAKDESIETILEMAAYKETGNCKYLLVTGCLTQRYGADLQQEMPEIDGMLGANQYERLPELLAGLERGGCAAYLKRDDHFYEGPRVLTTPSYSAYVKIGDGCDNRCSYCAIPLIRGGYRSRDREAILSEVRGLAQSGVREISLIAQDTTRYATDWQKGKSGLAQLLRETSAIAGVDWLRALYCYPARVDEALLDVIAETPNICPYVDLPIQHINPRLLKEMNRHGTAEHIRDVVEWCKARGLTTRTSIIVGFPGETEADVQELLDFLAWAQFDRLGAFAFSPEEDTPAYDMPDQIPEEEKQHRLDAVMRLQQGISLSRNQQRVGDDEQVLVEGVEQGRAYGRTRREAPEIDGKVFFAAGAQTRPGEFQRVHITGAEEYDLTGELL